MADILRSHQISGAIIDLIETTTRHCYLVTPWVQPWPNLDRTLEQAARRKLRVTFILRHETNSRHVSQAKRLNQEFGFEVIELEYLHTKLYLGDKKAIIGSMNLYDVSQTRNFELATVVERSSEIQQLRRDVIEADLLVAKPFLHLPGRFEAERVQEVERKERLAAEFATKGFCLICGDRSPLQMMLEPTYVRCKACWGQAPDVDFTQWKIRMRWKIRKCHFCGEPHASVVARPFHNQCKDQLAEFLQLSK